MFDSMRLSTRNFDIDRIQRNPRFVWNKFRTNEHDELTTRWTTNKYRTIELTLIFRNNQPELTVRLSLHKYFEQGVNWTDFPMHKVQAAIAELSEELEIPADELHVHFLEFGANIPTDRTPPAIFGKYHFYKRRMFSDAANADPNATFNEAVCRAAQIDIKAYDKGRQYGFVNLMRFEIKVKKMQFLHSKNIDLFLLSDLVKPEIWHGLECCLLRVYSDIFKFENVDERSMTSSERNRYAQGQRYDYWPGLLKNATDANFQKRKQRYSALMRKFRVDNIHEIVQAQLIEKIRVLANTQTQNVQNITTLQNGIDRSLPAKNASTPNTWFLLPLLLI